MSYRHHREAHRLHRAGWLRAAVLGANDGIVSTASLVVGVAAAGQDRSRVLIAGIAGLIAGALSMAAGEYVSVSSQSDLETADLEQERRELAANPEGERAELASIYEARGLTSDLAVQVAEQLSRADPLAAHARDELGLTDFASAKPLQASMASALSFAVGALLPILTAIAIPAALVREGVAASALIGLAVLGAYGAKAGGALVGRAVLRVAFWGAFALALSSAAGAVLGVALG